MTFMDQSNTENTSQIYLQYALRDEKAPGVVLLRGFLRLVLELFRADVRLVLKVDVEAVLDELSRRHPLHALVPSKPLEQTGLHAHANALLKREPLECSPIYIQVFLPLVP